MAGLTPVPSTVVEDAAPVDAVAGPRESVRMGVVLYTEPAPNSEIVQATVSAICAKLKNYDVIIEKIARDDLEDAVKNGEVDIFLSSAGFYRRLVGYGALALATAISPTYPDPNHSEGTAIVVRNTDPYDTVASLRGKRLVVTEINGFSGYQIPMGEIAGRGYDPDAFFRSVREVGGGTHAIHVLDVLRDGGADVAFVKQCILESYVAKGRAAKDFFRVIEPTNQPGQCARSTQLYPTWTLGSSSAASPQVSRLVTSAVLDMPPTRDGLLWGVATDYSSVDELFKNLKVGPYEYLRHWTVRGFVTEFKMPIIISVLLVLGLIGHSIRVGQLVRQRTQELEDALSEQKRLQLEKERIADRMTGLEKIGVVNQISSILAHEMRQPLGAIALYLEGLKTLLESGTANREKVLGTLGLIREQTARADAIVEKVRAYRKGTAGISAAIDVSGVVSKAVENVRASFDGRKAPIEAEVQPGLQIRGDMLELELLTFNLVKNALEAVAEQPNGWVNVTLCVDPATDRLSLVVEDNGPIRTDEEAAALEGSVTSSKVNGLGLGIQIVKGIAERHQGRIRFSVRSGGGLRAEVQFPRVVP